MSRLILAVLLTVASLGSTLAQDENYVAGGPLAGVELPLYPTKHGEEPGHPGCVPELIHKGKAVRDMGTNYVEWGRQGLFPERHLYDGSVEHWRAYWFKYCPVRSFFDRQSQINNWTAAKLAPGAELEQYAEPVYWVPRHSAVRDTGKRNLPVPVLRWGVGGPRLKLDLGKLAPSMYAVRVIAAVEQEHLRTFRRPVWLRMRVNDGLKGETTEYKLRVSYCDEFYSMAEFYFNAPETRAYRAELWVEKGSEVDLLMHNVSLDDVLTGATRRAIKQRVVRAGGEKPKPANSKYDRAERLVRDAALWNYLPPLNHQGSGNSFRQASFNSILHRDVKFGAEVDGKRLDRKALQETLGEWTPVIGGFRRGFPEDISAADKFLVNKKLNLVYTLDDMIHYRPLPDPYSVKDDGTGVFYPDPESDAKGLVHAEIGIEVMHRIRNLPYMMAHGATAWRERGNVDAAHDAAMALARYAYTFPAMQSARYLNNTSRDPGAYNRNLYNRRMETAAFFLQHYAVYLKAPAYYDSLFDYIQGNQLLADSVGRFVPWVKTPEDVVKLIDVYLVQMTAKRVLRYHYYTDPMVIAELAAILGPGKVTDPWMDFLFSRTFIYPLPPGGIQNLMISGCGRSGAEYIGSTFYAQGEGARRVAGSLQRFKNMGILPEKYDLTNTAIYPKPLAKCHWQFDIVMGGRDFCRIGDVCGPDKRPGATLGRMSANALDGWRWSKDPKFAWVIANKVGRKKYGGTDEQWAEVLDAAKAIKRAPWLDNRSRQVPVWFGALEAGVEYDDFRNRRGVYVRTGAGMGHHHDDTLDLQFYAMGLPMTVDGGQRPGYAKPGDRSTRVHNTVEVNERSHRANSWVRTLSDAEGARYLSADAAPKVAGGLFRRDVALIDVAGAAKPTSYIVDIFRVAGGSTHTHCFHGPISDEVVPNAELKPVAADAGTPEAAYLRPFNRSKETWRAGTAPDMLETTWRYRIENQGLGAGEKSMSGGRLAPNAPRKYTRLALLGVKGLRVMHADQNCTKWKYRLNCQMVQRTGENLQSVFPAVIDLSAGPPEAGTIKSKKLIQTDDADASARKAVAVAVETTNGQKDVLFFDGTPDAAVTAGGVTAKAEFACVSRDQQGLRAAAITGGTELKADGVHIMLDQAEVTATITGVDYLTKRITHDGLWPASLNGGIVEIIAPGRKTSYTTTSVDGRTLSVKRGADYFRSVITGVDEAKGVVTCQLKPSLGQLPGLVKGWTATNDARTKVWRAEVLDKTRFRLTGAPVKKADFQPDGVLRLWEYGVGDTLRMATHVGVRRVKDGWEVTANAQCVVSLPNGVDHVLTSMELAKAGGVIEIRK